MNILQKKLQSLVLWFNTLSRVTKLALIITLFAGSIGILLQFIFPERVPQIAAISPNFERGVPETSNFTISFAQVLPESTQKDISISMEPTVYGESFFLNNNYELYFQLSEKMELNTEYTLRVLYKNKPIYTHTFVTNEFTALERAEQIRQQSLDDQKFSEQQKKQEQEFPWIFKMPLKTDEYVIVYDFEREEFRIRLQVVEPTNEEIKTNLQNNALKAFESIDVDPEEWGYYFLYLD